MIKGLLLRVLFVFTLILTGIFASSVYAQNPTNTSFLRQNGINLLQKAKEKRNIAFSRAKDHGWPTLRLRKDGGIVSLQRIDDFGLPIYYTTQNNIIAAATTATNQLYLGGSLGLSLNGSTITGARTAIWDGGAVLTNHVEFATNRVEIKDGTTATNIHSTHVAGTMIASGVNPAAKGMAFALPKLYSFDFNNDNSEMSSNAAGLLISNHSYGTIAGWDLNTEVTPNRWEYYGAPNSTEDYKFGYYDSDAAEWDKICFNAPYYLPVKSAGNNRSSNGPPVGGAYYRYNAQGTMINAGTRPQGISSNDGYGIIATNGTAKNILTIGAVNPLPNGPTSSTITMSSFSSWGPTDDGRIKPDLVGDGINVTSSSSESVNAYVTYSGTSMASPNVSGSLILLQELYNQKNNAFMRAATLKGLAIGTAVDAGNVGPDYIYGWGLLNTEAAAKVILSNGTASRIVENTLTQGEIKDLTVVASGNGPLIATICWTDPEATAVATSIALNNSAARLVNDLDLRAIQGSTAILPWVLNPASPATAATKGDNFRDNVEQIYIADAVPGRTYTIRVSHKGSLQRGPQGYSLILSGVGGTSYCTSGPNSTAGSRINNFTLNDINNSSPTLNCTSYSDYTNLVVALEKGKSYPLSLSLGTCGGDFNKIAKVYIDWNADGDFLDANELVATSDVISGTSVYTTSIAVPGNITTDAYSLLRVVLTETISAAAVSPCGTYEKGETQDYRVHFLMPALDASVKALVTPALNICANATQNVRVTLKNYGSQSISNLPVTVVVAQGGTTLTTLNGTFTGTLASLGEIDFTLPGTFNAEPGKSYTLNANTVLAGDADLSNNQLAVSVQVYTAPIAAADSKAYFCNSFNAYSLNSSGDGTIYWYKTATTTLPFAYGNTVTTTEAPEGNTYYAGVNDYRSELGPKNKADVGGGTYNKFDPAVLVSTGGPVVLESAKLYIGNSGRVKFTVTNGLGVAVSSVMLAVTATRANPAAGELSNDVNDQGQTYPLNLVFPTAGNYTISVEYLDGATLFRNNVGNTNYPYSAALDLFKILSNTASAPSIPANFYYYFYDVKVKAVGCSSTTRLAVPLTLSSITKNGAELSVSGAGTYQWYMNGIAISGATAKAYTPLQNGKYTVDVTIPGGCNLRSGEYTFTDIPTDSGEMDIDLKVYPVPSDGELNVKFNLPQEADFSLVVTNMVGQVVYKENKNNYLGQYSTQIFLRTQENGVYIITIRSGGRKFSRKITLVK